MPKQGFRFDEYIDESSGGKTPVIMAAVFRVESAVRLCFLASIVYLPALLATMVLDRITE